MTALPQTIQASDQPKRYLSCADTAKLIRQALKEAFPEIKFSVRSSTYSMGASIRVCWTDGPITSQVEPIAKMFAGAGFDGMQDLKTTKKNILDGEPVRFGADYVFCERDVSADKVTAVTELLEKAGKDNWLTLSIRMGIEGCAICNSFDAREAAFFLLRNAKPETFEGRTSKLANSITYLGEV